MAMAMAFADECDSVYYYYCNWSMLNDDAVNGSLTLHWTDGPVVLADKLTFVR